MSITKSGRACVCDWAEQIEPDRVDTCSASSYCGTSFSEQGGGVWCARGYAFEGTAVWDVIGKAGSALVCA
ncbi:hypothetical protein ACOBQX_02965 [Actinokineospora sp. G85]|uniref:hypothetical protein n=1 Tax=Actinokineospora sp. G85 TaxID=3406626 RepID=UPI003C71F80A